jgi:signal transduction histidine kinase
VGSYLIVILLTVLFLEIALIFSIRYYYEQNIKMILASHAEMSAHLFERYLADEHWEERSAELLDNFSLHTSAQVQILNASGRLLQDTNGLPSNLSFNRDPDVQQALAGEPGSWKGTMPVTREPVLAVSYPLIHHGQTVGVVRFVTSLTGVEDAIQTLAIVLVLIGLMVVALVAAISWFLAKTIVGPVIDLTKAAEKMAEGDFSVRAKKRYNDELGKLADTLNLMVSQISRSEQLKNEFISSISHELRTPLTNIKGWAITLRTGKHDKRVKLEDGLEVIEQESDRLSRLVEELLDFSKFEAGRIVLRKEPLHIPELLMWLEKQLKPRALRQSLIFQVKADDQLPVISADEYRLKQVLINLVDNAFKFTDPHGHVHVHASKTDKHVIITVEDTGIGIPEDELPHVFQKFYKGTSNVAGSGLGLAIAKEMIKLHGGQIVIDSKEGTGTKVQVFLPY